MRHTQAVIEGTLNPDGSLALDHKPDLPPGRVTVRVQSLTELPPGDAFFCLSPSQSTPDRSCR